MAKFCEIDKDGNLELNYDPNPKQDMAIRTEANEIMFGGAKAGGKSWMARAMSVLFGLQLPGIQIYIFRQTFSEVRGNFLFGTDGFQNMLRPLEKAGIVQINLAENRIHFNQTDADIYLRHMANSQDVEQIRGRDIHVLICDEATQWMTRDIYNQLRTCMRCSIDFDYSEVQKTLPYINPGYFPRAYILTNPGGRAHSFIKQEFIDSLEPMVPKDMPVEKGGMKRIFIPAVLEDNEHLLRTDPNYKYKLMGSGKHMKAMLEGDWSIPEGSALGEEWDFKWNVMKPFEIPASATIKRCFDWGIAKPFAVSYVWETRNEAVKLADGTTKTFAPGTMIVIGELYGWDGNADEGCRKTAKVVGEMIKRYEMMQPWAFQIQPGPSDGSIWNGTGTDKTINDDVIDGFNGLRDETMAYGKTMRNALFIKADKSKGSRAKGLAMVKSYLYGAHGEEVDGEIYPSEKPGLIFFDTCKHCLRTLPVIPFDNNDPDDVDTKSEDHIYDTIRYAVLGRTAHFERLELVGI